MVAQLLSALAITYSYNTTTSSSTSGGKFAILFVVILAIALIEIIALWKVFTKAGRPGWAAIIPIYNYWVLFEIAGKPGWWALAALLSIIPFVGWIVFAVLYIIAALEIAKRFGKSTAFAVFGLVIFSVIGYLMLGYGDAKYQVSGGTPQPPTAPPAPAA